MPTPQSLRGCALDMRLDVWQVFFYSLVNHKQANKWIFKAWIFEVGYADIFILFGAPQSQFLNIKKVMNMTNVFITKHLLTFQQPMNHTNSASPACYWHIRWEIPAFQSKWHSDLNEWKSTHMYLPLCLYQHALYLLFGQKVQLTYQREGSGLITTMIKVFVSIHWINPFCMVYK